MVAQIFRKLQINFEQKKQQKLADQSVNRPRTRNDSTWFLMISADPRQIIRMFDFVLKVKCL